jgi:hypothetical protein
VKLVKKLYHDGPDALTTKKLMIDSALSAFE